MTILNLARASRPRSIVSVNYVLSDVEAKELLLDEAQHINKPKYASSPVTSTPDYLLNNSYANEYNCSYNNYTHTQSYNEDYTNYYYNDSQEGGVMSPYSSSSNSYSCSSTDSVYHGQQNYQENGNSFYNENTNNFGEYF